MLRYYETGPMRTALNWAQLAAALITIAGVVLASYNVEKVLDLQRETFTINLYNDWNTRYERSPSFIDTVYTNNPKNWNESYTDFAHYTLFVCESIYHLKKNDPAWENTIYELLTPHIKYYDYVDALGPQYESDFRAFYAKTKIRYTNNIDSISHR